MLATVSLKSLALTVTARSPLGAAAEPSIARSWRAGWVVGTISADRVFCHMPLDRMK